MPVIQPDASYTGAWNEAMRRIVARDNVILGYVAVCATLLGVAIRQDGKAELALAIPLITMVAGALVAHHDFLIAMLNKYLREFEISGYEAWHRRILTRAALIGLFLHTLPAVSVAFTLTYVSIQVAASVPATPALNELKTLGPFAGWIGTALFAVGRTTILIAAVTTTQRAKSA